MSFSAVKATSIGFHHAHSQRPCQDYSSAVSNAFFSIAITADGHGSPEYIRSSVGSKLAVQALKMTFLEFFMHATSLFVQDPELKSFRLKLLSRWNDLVLQHVTHHPWTDSEMKDLSSNQRQMLEQSPYRAYGTTLNGSIITAHWSLSVQIGDGIVVMKNAQGSIQSIFPREEEQVGATTHSLCEDDAFDHLHTKLQHQPVEWILHGTDGLVNPYQTYAIFDHKITIDFMNYIQPLQQVRQYKEVRNLTCILGLAQGTGDDVSLAIAFFYPPHYQLTIQFNRNWNKTS